MLNTLIIGPIVSIELTRCHVSTEKSQGWGAVWPDHVSPGHHRERLLRSALHGLCTSSSKRRVCNLWRLIFRYAEHLSQYRGSEDLSDAKTYKTNGEHTRSNISYWAEAGRIEQDAEEREDWWEECEERGETFNSSSSTSFFSAVCLSFSPSLSLSLFCHPPPLSNIVYLHTSPVLM